MDLAAVSPAPGAPRVARNARGRRAQDAIADALLALLREGDLRATAPRIAARAGVSLRTVFHHFPDLEGLHQAAGTRQLARIHALMQPIDAATPLAARVDAFARQRARVLEFIAPVRRAALLLEPFSAAVARSLADVRASKRAQATQVFAAELVRLPAEAAAALGATASFCFWDALRRDQRLSAPRARRVLAESITRLLGGAGSPGGPR